MAEMTIRLQIDPQTGKKNIIVSLDSDSDALPHEHEQQHRALVEKLIQKGLVKASELGEIVVEREDTQPEASSEIAPESPNREAQGQSGT